MVVVVAAYDVTDGPLYALPGLEVTLLCHNLKFSHELGNIGHAGRDVFLIDAIPIFAVVDVGLHQAFIAFKHVENMN